MVKKIVIIFCLLFLPAGFTFAAQAQRAVRVAILQDAPLLYLKISGYFEIRDLNTKRLIHNGRNLKRQLVKAYADKINFSDIRTGSARIKIIPLKKGLIYCNSRPLRGEVNLIRKDNGNILVVNELDLEDYCLGVLPHEVAYWWPLEALKAQAVIARTYCLYHMQFSALKDYDLTSDIYSQVYGGKIAERWRTSAAVKLTRGRVLTFQGNIFATYYHATSGGHTEDANNLWKVDIIPLKGAPCGFCADSPHFRWKVEIPLEEIESKLSDKGFKVEDITEIGIVGRNPSGRITELEIRGRDNSLIISAKDFRQTLGPNVLRSTNFIIKIISGKACFEGFGWGHGVGLCQWGAYFMAKKGKKFDQILGYYFPGSQLSAVK